MNMMNPKAFGLAIKNARKVAGLSQRAVADKLGLSVNSIREVERGERSFDELGLERFRLAINNQQFAR